MYDACFSSLYAKSRQLNPEVFKALLLMGSIGEGSRVLEVGCGTGNYILPFKATTGCSCWGLDPSAAMLSKAKRQAKDIFFQAGKAETIGFQDGLFDMLFSVDVIHHVDSPSAYFQEAYRVLKTGGKICTVTDSAWMIRNRQPLATYFPEIVTPESERYPPIAQLREIMWRVGFRQINEEMVEFQYELHDLRPYEAKLFSCLHLISEDAFQRGLDKMRKALLTSPIPGISRALLLWGEK